MDWDKYFPRPSRETEAECSLGHGWSLSRGGQRGPSLWVLLSNLNWGGGKRGGKVVREQVFFYILYKTCACFILI